MYMWLAMGCDDENDGDGGKCGRAGVAYVRFMLINYRSGVQGLPKIYLSAAS